MTTALAIARSAPSGAGPFDPSSLTGLKLWLKADSLALADNDPVGTWADSSGSGNDATQATGGKKPLYKTNVQNGKPGILFDGTDDVLALAGIILPGRPFTAFMVYEHQLGGAAFGTILTADDLAGFWHDDSTNTLAFSDGVGIFNSSTTVADGTARVYSFVNDGAPGDAASVVLNGSADGTFSGVGAAGFGSGSNPVNAIGDTPEADGPIKGHIFEILLYDAVLGSTDRGDVETYLKTKYGL